MITNNLIEKIAAYKIATQSLIDKTNEYEEFIKANIPSELWGKFDIGQFGSGQNYEYHISIDGKLIPSTVEKFDTSFYYGGDYNYRYERVTPKELIAWCRNLPALIAEAEEYIEQLTKEAEELAK